MKNTRELEEMLQSYKEKPDCNHWLRRFYRCYIDGSYKGEGHYQNNVKYLRSNKDKPRRTRQFAIRSFVEFLMIEYPFSYAIIQDRIKKAFTPNELKTLTNELIDDSLDLIVDYCID